MISMKIKKHTHRNRNGEAKGKGVAVLCCNKVSGTEAVVVVVTMGYFFLLLYRKKNIKPVNLEIIIQYPPNPPPSIYLSIHLIQSISFSFRFRVGSFVPLKCVCVCVCVYTYHRGWYSGWSREREGMLMVALEEFNLHYTQPPSLHATQSIPKMKN